jgi:hypothetical protein
MLNANRRSERGGISGWGLPAAVGVLGAISLYALVSLYQERNRSQELAAQNLALNNSLRKLQGEIQSASDKPSPLAAQPAPPLAAEAPVVPPPPPVKAAHRTVTRPKTRSVAAHTPARKTADEARLQQLESNLANQQEEIADARQQVDRNRQEIEGKLSSAHEELSGSIAKNHDELVALEKRGQRNYYEFDLSKSKQFQHIGPLSVSVRGVNVKHKYYDLAVIVDDQQLEKKRVNLYEPLMFTVADRPQPIELVVNELKNNEIKGYVSDSRYKKSELNVTSASPAQDNSKGLQRR